MDAIRTVFQKYGFQPLETPAMENLTTLTGNMGMRGTILSFPYLIQEISQSQKLSIRFFQKQKLMKLFKE